MYQFQRYTKSCDFLEKCLSWLEEKEAANNLLLGLALHAHQSQDAEQGTNFMASLSDSAVLKVACFQTPGQPLILSAQSKPLPAADLESYIELIETYSTQVKGLIGPKEIVLQLSQGFENQKAKASKIVLNQGVYRLEKLIPPPMQSGSMRLAKPKDLEVLKGWYLDFYQEIGMPKTEAEIIKLLNTKVNNRDCFIWEVDQLPVATAAKVRPLRHGIAINGVYTPPEHRGKGYASTLMAQLSQALLDEGYAFCALFTDINFSTSNRIYQRIGYEKVADFMMTQFV